LLFFFLVFISCSLLLLFFFGVKSPLSVGTSGFVPGCGISQVLHKHHGYLGIPPTETSSAGL
jgi:hypothetical protein